MQDDKFTVAEILDAAGQRAGALEQEQEQKQKQKHEQEQEEEERKREVE